ncbi:MAG: ATP-binding protein [Candidatus Odinarchaeota archaeon]
MDNDEKPPLKTHFAPAERKELPEILKEVDLIVSADNLQELLNSLPYFALILNQERQILFANESLLAAFGMNTIQETLGARPGEILQCIHDCEEEGGCGTSRSCRYCRAVLVLLESQKKGQRMSDDCRITSLIDGKKVSFDLNVTAKPITLQGHIFSLVHIIDISNQKQKERLERIFFHDILNTVSGVMGLIEGFPCEGLRPEHVKFIQQLDESCNRLVAEIEDHRKVLDAETGRLKPHFTEIKAQQIIQSAIEGVKYLDITSGKTILTDIPSSTRKLVTDPRLLQRVLLNLLKNAVEASIKGDTIKIGFHTTSSGKMVFWINNPAFMPPEISHQVFQRSFSTKGKGRGTGLYSAKLLIEQYLKGDLIFETSEEKGTTFHVTVPLTPLDSPGIMNV